MKTTSKPTPKPTKVNPQRARHTTRQAKAKPVAKNNATKLMGYAAGAGIVLGVGYLAFTYFQNKAAQSRALPDTKADNNTTFPTTITNSNNQNNQFPLRLGSRGTLVKVLQQLLLAKGGKSAAIIKSTSLKGNKVDGIFGSGTAKALIAASLPTQISQALFTSISGKANPTHTSSVKPQQLASRLITAANARNLFSTLDGLQQIQNAKQYVAVSSFFKNIRINAIRVTSLVNALLSVAFKNNTPAKNKIRAEFRRMGLQQNSRGIWVIPSLGNLDTPEKMRAYMNDQQRFALAITDKPTLLKMTDGTFLTPPLHPNTLVGYVEQSANGITQIRSPKGERVYAPSVNLRFI